MAAMARSGIEVLDRAASQLLVVDIQAKLIPTIHAVEAMVAHIRSGWNDLLASEAGAALG